MGGAVIEDDRAENPAASAQEGDPSARAAKTSIVLAVGPQAGAPLLAARLENEPARILALRPFAVGARKLDDSGVILGSRLIVDPKMMGFDVCAHISITLKDPQLLKQTVEQLKEIPEIVEAHFITGSGNILVKLYCVDNEHLMRTIFDGILRIQGIATTETNISLQEVFQREVNIDFIDE